MSDHLTLEQLAALVDGAPGTGAALHVQQCDRCRREFETLRQLAAAVAQLPDRPAPADEWERIMARRPRPRVPVAAPGSFMARVMQPSVLRRAATIVLLFGGGMLLGYVVAQRRGARASVDLVALTQQLGSISARSVIGAEVVPLDSLLGARLGLRQGLLVLRVPAGTPAAQLGLQPWDVITAVNGIPVATIAQFRSAAATGARIEWRRDGAALEGSFTAAGSF